MFMYDGARLATIPIAYDLAVIGGGTSGVFAAISAARAGLRVALVESSGMLGGTMTQVTLGGICGAWTHPAQTQVVHGLFDELVDRLRHAGGCSDLYRYNRIAALPYDPIRMRACLDDMLPDGVDVLHHSRFVTASVQDRQVRNCLVTNAYGLFSLEAKVFIDASGNAELAKSAGVACRRGDQGTVQAASSMFRVIGVSENADSTALRHSIKQSIEASQALPRSNVAVYVHPDQRITHLNATRIQFDAGLTEGLDGVRDLARVEREGRRQAYAYLDHLRAHIPEFKDASIVDMGAAIGVRDSLNIVNACPLTVQDILAGAKPANSVAYSAWPVEYHGSEQVTSWQYLPDDDYYGISFDGLLPDELDNLLVVGRSISTDTMAQASARVTAPCMQMGESAGLAAYLYVDQSADRLSAFRNHQFIKETP